MYTYVREHGCLFQSLDHLSNNNLVLKLLNTLITKGLLIFNQKGHIAKFATIYIITRRKENSQRSSEKFRGPLRSQKYHWNHGRRIWGGGIFYHRFPIYCLPTYYLKFLQLCPILERRKKKNKVAFLGQGCTLIWMSNMICF